MHSRVATTNSNVPRQRFQRYDVLALLVCSSDYKKSTPGASTAQSYLSTMTNSGNR